MAPIHPNRREFFRQSSLAALSLSVLRAQEAKSVIAETSFGKVRGVDNAGIKTFKGILYGRTRQASTGSCRPSIRQNGPACGMRSSMAIALPSAIRRLSRPAAALASRLRVCPPRARIVSY